MRKKIIAGNWKMNNTLEEGNKLASEVIHMYEDELGDKVELWMTPPFIHLASVARLAAENTSIVIAAQNIHQEKSGAFTGEISADMVASTGARGVILGHSERRHFFAETDELIREKCLAALAAGLKIILCVGEKLDERESGKQEEVVSSQIRKVLKEIPVSDRGNFIIAYEPVWAIGTGKTASPDQAAAMHDFIRSQLLDLWADQGNDIPLLYGGSCNPANAEGLFSCKNIDGGLIGGASLKSRDFMDMAKTLAKS